MEILQQLHRIALMVKVAGAILAAGTHGPAVALLQDARDQLNDALDDLGAELETRDEPVKVQLHLDHHDS